MTLRVFMAHVADWLCLRLAPGKYIINPKWRPFEKLAAEVKGGTGATLAAQQLIYDCVNAGGSRITVEVDGFSISGREIGDWRVTVERLGQSDTGRG